MDGRNARSQSLVGGDEENVRIVSGERLVVNRGQRAAQRPVFNQFRCDQSVRRMQHSASGRLWDGGLIAMTDRLLELGIHH